MSTPRNRIQTAPKLPAARLREYKPLTNGVEAMRGFAKPRSKWTEHRGLRPDQVQAS